LKTQKCFYSENYAKKFIALDFYSQLCNLAVNIWAKYDISPFLNAWA